MTTREKGTQESEQKPISIRRFSRGFGRASGIFGAKRKRKEVSADESSSTDLTKKENVVIERVDEDSVEVLPPVQEHEESIQRLVSQRMSVKVAEDNLLDAIQSTPVVTEGSPTQALELEKLGNDEPAFSNEFNVAVYDELLAVAQKQSIFSNRNVVFKDNRLINASYSLPLNHLRLILVAISKADNKQILPNTFYRITAQDLIKTGVPKTSVKVVMQEVFDTLYKQTVDLIMNVASDGTEEHVRLNWVDAMKFNPENRYIDVCFSALIVPYISSLGTNYTSYSLEAIRYMRSPNTIRIYEMIMQYQATGIYITRIDHFLRRLNISASYKPAMLRTRILDQAVQDINKATKMAVSYDLKASDGRKFDIIFFKWSVSRAKKLSSEKFDGGLTQKQAYHFATLLHSDEAFRSEWGKGHFVSWKSLFPKLVQELLDPANMSYFEPWLQKHGFDPNFKTNQRKKKKSVHPYEEELLRDDVDVDPSLF